MKALSIWMARKIAPGCEDPLDITARARVGQMEGWVSVVINVLLAALKAGLGLLSGSVSLLADAVHTLSDSITSLVVIVGFRVARRPPDEEHPFGHGRVEHVASLIIGVLLAVTALELGHSAVERVLDPQPVDAPAWLILAVAATIIPKELLARFSSHLGQFIQSDTLEADAWHHRSDVLATALVVVSFAGAHLGLPWIDGVAGVGVALLLAWAAAHIVKEAVVPLLGSAPPAALRDQVAQLALSVEGVAGAHQISIQSFGTRYVVSLHVELRPDLDLPRAHEICRQVSSRLTERLTAQVTVHPDPVPAVAV